MLLSVSESNLQRAVPHLTGTALSAACHLDTENNYQYDVWEIATIIKVTESGKGYETTNVDGIGLPRGDIQLYI
ncbi:hypothetical protein MU1_13250 [Paenibacillus glycanilyticus]|uniref:Uncharacterized protein n=1 Tax=Paenibacillus glycanilyticus TaxID=126569 RepID=A0ABQ6GBL2_9BACL|nr:hypothetical protein MU1_13250 [Paenibacillus glycanilyticus]